jgi:hypothetical protein
VTIAIAEAVIAPTKYEALKKEVKVARSLGWPSSPIKEEPEIMHRTIPKPRIILATMYVATSNSSALSTDVLERRLTALSKTLNKCPDHHDQ